MISLNMKIGKQILPLKRSQMDNNICKNALKVYDQANTNYISSYTSEIDKPKEPKQPLLAEMWGNSNTHCLLVRMSAAWSL